MKNLTDDKGRASDSGRILVCTVEKANIVLNQLLMEGTVGRLAMVVVDEAHLLSEKIPLELTLTKLRHMQRTLPREGSFGCSTVCFSATLPNAVDMASWLNKSVFVSAAERPTPLDIRIAVNSSLFANHSRPKGGTSAGAGSKKLETVLLELEPFGRLLDGALGRGQVPKGSARHIPPKAWPQISETFESEKSRFVELLQSLNVATLVFEGSKVHRIFLIHSFIHSLTAVSTIKNACESGARSVAAARESNPMPPSEIVSAARKTAKRALADLDAAIWGCDALMFIGLVMQVALSFVSVFPADLNGTGSLLLSCGFAGACKGHRSPRISQRCH